MKTQRERLLDWLQSGLSITRLESWDKLGILETPSRCSELRAMGYPIVTEMIEVTNRYGEKTRVARWSLPGEEPF